MDGLLSTITESLTSVKEAINDGAVSSSKALTKSSEGISLLALKNHAMLSYLHNLVLIIASRLALVQTDEEESEKIKELRQIIEEATKATVVERVVLEKGVKGLETKIAYQIEKVMRAHARAQQAEEQAEEAAKAGAAAAEVDSDSDNEDALNYKPNPFALKTAQGAAVNGEANGTANGDGEPVASKEKYQAPKIQPVTPFGKERTKARSRRDATMEEYVRGMSDMPTAEPSIGSTIMDNGRGGESTEKDRAKLQKVQNYEEENYTRLPGLSKKQETRAARQRQRDAFGKSFFGEDWTFLDRRGEGVETTTKRRKENTSVWERTKKRQRR